MRDELVEISKALDELEFAAAAHQAAVNGLSKKQALERLDAARSHVWELITNLGASKNS